MRIIPVIDLKAGKVVRGVGGRRDEYQPILSRLTNSHEPLAVARTFVERFAPQELYIADLDAIERATPALEAISRIQALGAPLWVDGGVRGAADAQRLVGSGVDRVVCGLETLTGPDDLDEIVAAIGRDRVIFSLDLRAGLLLGNVDRWQAADAADVQSVIELVVRTGIKRVIVLDLARVGMNDGAGTEEICRTMLARHAGVEFFIGGGVRDVRDLMGFETLGIKGALVASALHDGTISPADLDGPSRSAGRQETKKKND